MPKTAEIVDKSTKLLISIVIKRLNTNGFSKYSNSVSMEIPGFSDLSQPIKLAFGIWTLVMISSSGAIYPMKSPSILTLKLPSDSFVIALTSPLCLHCNMHLRGRNQYLRPNSIFSFDSLIIPS